MTETEHQAERANLCECVARKTDITDQRLLEAFRRVPRHRFIRAEEQEHAYEDRALPIGEDQTISQPSMIALMLDALRPKPADRALEVGGGSGYAAGLLGTLVESVDTLEIRPALASRARAVLRTLGIENVRVHARSGERGFAERAPFDVILVSAGARFVPPVLVDQLALGGRIAIPVGDGAGQHLLVGQRFSPTTVEWETRTPCVFVPLVTGGDSAQAEPTVRDVNAIGVVPARS